MISHDIATFIGCSPIPFLTFANEDQTIGIWISILEGIRFVNDKRFFEGPLEGYPDLFPVTNQTIVRINVEEGELRDMLNKAVTH